jgi:hypothetical protein
VDALHRLVRRGFVELRRDHVPYLERLLEAQPDFPDEDGERRSLWVGEPMLLSTNPIGSIADQMAMHMSAVAHTYETDMRLPRRRRRASGKAATEVRGFADALMKPRRKPGC